MAKKNKHTISDIFYTSNTVVQVTWTRVQALFLILSFIEFWEDCTEKPVPVTESEEKVLIFALNQSGLNSCIEKLKDSELIDIIKAFNPASITFDKIHCLQDSELSDFDSMGYEDRERLAKLLKPSLKPLIKECFYFYKKYHADLDEHNKKLAVQAMHTSARAHEKKIQDAQEFLRRNGYEVKVYLKKSEVVMNNPTYKRK